jgi:hypothetical protein
MNTTQGLLSSAAGSVAVIALVLALLALGGVVLLLARQQRLLGQYQQLMKGTSGGDLETLLHEHVGRVNNVASQMEQSSALIHELEEQTRYSLQHAELVRFNPFRDTGGDQSFALALADSDGNGVVLSSLHTRDMTRVYAKPLHTWASTHSLTDEEQQAIATARMKKT